MAAPGLGSFLTSYLGNSDDEDSGFEDTAGPSEPAAPTTAALQAPPTDREFNSRQEAMEWLNNFTSSQGYALTTANSKRKKGTSEINIVYLKCDRGGSYRNRIEETTRV